MNHGGDIGVGIQKETWALASMLVYIFVLHMRFIPKLKSMYAFNLASLIAFSSIIMTYFGVNFYLSGLHSYAAGDPMPIPDFIPYSIIVVFITASLAFLQTKDITKMKYLILTFLIVLFFGFTINSKKSNIDMNKRTFYEHEVNTIDGIPFDLSSLKGKNY